MANPQHLAWLKEDVEAWNERRRQNDFVPDLEGAKLRGAPLDGINLQDAALGGADLREAKLRKANLKRAKLRGADMEGVNLQGANLEKVDLGSAGLDYADLNAANMGMANLRRAFMRKVDLQNANLRGANLQRAVLDEAVLWRTDLRGADLTDASLRDTDVRSVPAETNQGEGRKRGLAQSLSHARLSQMQLQTMIGDSLTYIPDYLMRPAHWPEFDPLVGEHQTNTASSERAEAHPAESQISIIVRGASQFSRIEMFQRDGKLDVSDKPALMPPAKVAPQTLAHLVDGQSEAVRLLINAIEARQSNWSIPTLIDLFKSYQSSLDPVPTNWFRLSGPFNIAQDLLDDETLGANTPTTVARHFKQVKSFHEQIRPYLEPDPDLTPSRPELPTTTAPIDPQALASAARDALKILTSPDTENVLHGGAQSYLQKLAAATERTAEMETFGETEERTKQKSMVSYGRRLLADIGETAKDIVTHCTKRFLTDEDAATRLAVLLTDLTEVLAKIVQLLPG